MQKIIAALKQETDGLRTENGTLKGHHTHNPVQDKEDKGTWGRADQGRWRAVGWADVDPWKDWIGRNKTWKGDDEWVNDEGKLEQKIERDVKDERTTRVWWGGCIDRRNETVAMRFKRNTHWKNIKSKVEEVMGKSRVTNGGVNVIGQMASFAIIRFDAYENKHEFKQWLQTYGEEVKRKRGIWVGYNVDKDARARKGRWGR